MKISECADQAYLRRKVLHTGCRNFRQDFALNAAQPYDLTFIQSLAFLFRVDQLAFIDKAWIGRKHKQVLIGRRRPVRHTKP